MNPPDDRSAIRPNARLAALEYLLDADRRVDRRRGALSALAPADRALFLELTAGAMRRRITLDHVIQAFSSAPLAKIQPLLLEILRLGAYQLIFLRGAKAFAVVDESVKCVPPDFGPKSRGFVNAVLRRLADSLQIEAAPAPPRSASIIDIGAGQQARFERAVLPDPKRSSEEWEAAHSGFSLEAYRLLASAVAKPRLAAVLAAANARPALTLRPNSLRTTAADLVERLRAEGFNCDQRSDGLIAWPEGDPSATAAFAAGLYMVQGAFAARVATLVEPKAGERILDVCAPPGGKACHLAELAPKATVTALAVDEIGADRIRENAERLGLTNLMVRPWSRSADRLPEGPWDAILLDVPCSNSGVLDRRPEARHALTKQAVKDLVTVQRRLLRQALELAERQPTPARIVYATCSILPREDEDLVAGVLDDFPGSDMSDPVRAYPGPDSDGGYACLITVPSKVE